MKNFNKSSIALFIFVGLIIFSLYEKMRIQLAETSDFMFYVQQIQCFREVGYFSIIDSPVAITTLSFFTNLHFPSELLLLFVMTVIASLFAVPIYFLGNKLVGSTFGLLSVLIILFKDYFYIMIRYCMYKNLVGILIYLAFLYFLMRFAKKGDLAYFFVFIGLTFVQMMTYEVTFATQLLTLIVFLIFYKKEFFVLTMLMPLVGGLIISASVLSLVYLHYYVLIDFGFLSLNLLKTREAFSVFPIIISIGVFVYTLIKREVWREDEKAFILSLAVVGLVLHGASFLMNDYFSIRTLYMTQVPLAILLPYVGKKKTLSESWLMIFLCLALTIPYFARMVPGAWV
jgi:hypothetical protein